MPKKWEKIYKSNYGGGMVTPPNYLIECLCVLIAKHDKIELPHKFWKEKFWAKVWGAQSKNVNNILKTYPHQVVLEALRDRRCWKLRSFGANWLIEPILKEKLKLHEAQQKSKSDICLERADPTQKPRKQRGKQSIINKLRELDG